MVIDMNERLNIIVFGANGGIGIEIVSKLKTMYNIIAIDSNEGVMDLEEDSVTSIVLDLSNTEEYKKLKYCLNKGFKIFGVIFAMGIMIPGSTLKISEVDFEKTLEINITSIFRVTKIVLPYLLQNKNSHVIALSSSLGVVGAYDLCAYSTSKAAVIEYMKCLALDYGDKGLHANCISPGFVKTNMLNNAMKQFLTNKKWMFATGGLPQQYVEISEIVDTVQYLLNQKGLNGANIIIDHGYSVR